MCTFSGNFAFDKATNGQTDIKDEIGRSVGRSSLAVGIGWLVGFLVRCLAGLVEGF